MCVSAFVDGATLLFISLYSSCRLFFFLYFTTCPLIFSLSLPYISKARLAEAGANIQRALEVVRFREQSYRTPLVRVAGWRPGPTSYGYGFLWTVHSLFYWFRDYAIATISPTEALSPCFRNIENPIDVALGEGVLLNVTDALWRWIETTKPAFDFIADCLSAPSTEPHYSL